MFIYLFIYCHKDSEDKGFEGKKRYVMPQNLLYGQKKDIIMPQNLLHAHDGHFTP